MMIFRKARENAETIARTGADAVAEAKRLGVPAHYVDPALGEGIIREMPDGTRHRIVRVHGEAVVVESFRPRD